MVVVFLGVSVISSWLVLMKLLGLMVRVVMWLFWSVIRLCFIFIVFSMVSLVLVGMWLFMVMLNCSSWFVIGVCSWLGLLVVLVVGSLVRWVLS